MVFYRIPHLILNMIASQAVIEIILGGPQFVLHGSLSKAIFIGSLVSPLENQTKHILMSG